MEYQCIACLQTQGQKTNCVVCGYPVFKHPYDVKEVLIQGIESYISSIMKKQIPLDQMKFDAIKILEIKKPNLERIMKYCTNTEHSEDFYQRLYASLNLTMEYIKQSEIQSFDLNVNNLHQDLQNRRVEIYDYFSLAHRKLVFEDIYFEPITLTITRTPVTDIDDYIQFIESCMEWIQNLEQYTKQHGIYGTYYQEVNDNSDVGSNETSNDIISLQSVVVEKSKESVEIDFFSDGQEELTQLLNVFWSLFKRFLALEYTNEVETYLCRGSSYSRNSILSNIQSEYDRSFSLFDHNLKSNNQLVDYPMMILHDLYEEAYRKSLENQEELQYLQSIGKFNRQNDCFVGHEKKKEAIQKLMKDKNLYPKASSNIFYILGEAGTGKKRLVQYLTNALILSKNSKKEHITTLDSRTLKPSSYGFGWGEITKSVKESYGGVLVVNHLHEQLSKCDEQTCFGYMDLLFEKIQPFQNHINLVFIESKENMVNIVQRFERFQKLEPCIFECQSYTKKELEKILTVLIEATNLKITKEANNILINEIQQDQRCHAGILENWIHTLCKIKESDVQTQGRIDCADVERFIQGEANDKRGILLWNMIQ